MLTGNQIPPRDIAYPPLPLDTITPDSGLAFAGAERVLVLGAGLLAGVTGTDGAGVGEAALGVAAAGCAGTEATDARLACDAPPARRLGTATGG